MLKCSCYAFWKTLKKPWNIFPWFFYIRSHVLCILQEFIISKVTKCHYLKGTCEFLKIHTYKGIQVKKRRKLWKTAAICTNITFSVHGAKLTAFFSSNKNASTEPHNDSINLVFSVIKNLVYFWHVIFFLDVSHNILQNMTFWKEHTKIMNMIINVVIENITTWKKGRLIVHYSTVNVVNGKTVLKG